MLLVLLPGMHGTSTLFQPIIKQLKNPFKVVELPKDTGFTADSIANEIERNIPNQPCILLAESFSGGLIPTILSKTDKPIRGIIFVASFISCPNALLTRISTLLPTFLFRIRLLTKLGLGILFLNGNSNKVLLEQCVAEVCSLPNKVIKERLKLMAGLSPPSNVYQIKALYLRANQDRVIPKNKHREICECFPTRVVSIDGPHFLLQAEPRTCGQVIEHNLSYFSNDIIDKDS